MQVAPQNRITNSRFQQKQNQQGSRTVVDGVEQWWMGSDSGGWGWTVVDGVGQWWMGLDSSGRASWLRVCYQWGLPRLVFKETDKKRTQDYLLLQSLSTYLVATNTEDAAASAPPPDGPGLSWPPV